MSGNPRELEKVCPLKKTVPIRKKGKKVKRGIEDSVRKKSCPLTRVPVSGELTVKDFVCPLYHRTK